MTIRADRFWFAYFCVRAAYMLFAVFVYGSVSHLGDTWGYLAGNDAVSYDINTRLMFWIGGLAASLSGGNALMSNFPFMLLSFLCVRWAVETLRLRRRVNKKLLFILLSLPNFCIWTSVCSKECAGLCFSAILGVLFVRFMQGDFRLRRRDLLGTALCLIFKPQYLPFILQGLVYIYLSDKLALKGRGQMLLGVSLIVLDMGVLHFLRPLADELSFAMYAHFNNPLAQSTRDNIFLQNGDFYRYAPQGMFISFFGPTLGEMAAKPTHLIAGLESMAIIFLMLFLTKRSIGRFLIRGCVEPRYFFPVFLVITGICFIHYPFGIFNPGSAIRYRTNFIFLFILILLEWHIHDNVCEKNSLLRQQPAQSVELQR